MVARMDDHIISVSRDCVNVTGRIVIINFVGKKLIYTHLESCATYIFHFHSFTCYNYILCGCSH